MFFNLNLYFGICCVGLCMYARTKGVTFSLFCYSLWWAVTFLCYWHQFLSLLLLFLLRLPVRQDLNCFLLSRTHRDSFSYTHTMCIHLVVFVYVNLFWQFFAFRLVCTVPEIWQITQAVWLHTHTATCKSHLYTNTDKVMRIIYEWHWKTFTYVWVLVYMYAWVCMCYCRTANMVLASTFSCQKRTEKR